MKQRSHEHIAGTDLSEGMHVPRITGRIVAGFAFVGLAVLGILFYSTDRTRRDIDELGDFHMRTFHAVQELRRILTDAVQESFAYAASRVPKEKQEHFEHIAEFEERCEAFRVLASLDRPDEHEERALFERAVSAKEEMKRRAQALFRAVEERADIGEPFQAYEDSLEDAFSALDRLILIEEAEVLEARTKAIAGLRSARNWMIVASLVVVFAGLLVALFLARRIRTDVEDRLRVERDLRDAKNVLLEREATERQRIEQQLAKAKGDLVDQTRLASFGKMASQVSHELRNPLGVMRNALYLLRKKDLARDRRGEYHELIEREIETCDRIITNLLEITRGREPAKQRLVLSDAVEEAEVRAELPDGVGLVFSSDPSPFEVYADPVQFRQILDNLIRNALDAVGEAGEIRVDAQIEGDMQVITVTDSGPGVAVEDVEDVFEHFFTRKEKGTGLGLGICRKLIEGHGGTIHLVSLPQDDQGRVPAVLRVELPVQGVSHEVSRGASQAVNGSPSQLT